MCVCVCVCVYTCTFMFPVSGMDMRAGVYRKLSAEELMLLNYCVEDSQESLGHPTQSILKEISPGCALEALMLKLKLILGPPDAKS